MNETKMCASIRSSAGDLAEVDFPTEPEIYMFTEGASVMWTGTAAQGIRGRVFHHQLVCGRRSFLPIRKTGRGRGTTLQVMGCSLILHIARERIAEPLDMAEDDHRTIWREPVDRVFDVDVRWASLAANRRRAGREAASPAPIWSIAHSRSRTSRQDSAYSSLVRNRSPLTAIGGQSAYRRGSCRGFREGARPHQRPHYGVTYRAAMLSRNS